MVIEQQEARQLQAKLRQIFHRGHAEDQFEFSIELHFRIMDVVGQVGQLDRFGEMQLQILFGGDRPGGQGLRGVLGSELAPHLHQPILQQIVHDGGIGMQGLQALSMHFLQEMFHTGWIGQHEHLMPWDGQGVQLRRHEGPIAGQPGILPGGGDFPVALADIRLPDDQTVWRTTALDPPQMQRYRDREVGEQITLQAIGAMHEAA